MLGKNHLITGLASWALVSSLQTESVTMPVLFAQFCIAGFAALIADIDHPQSMLGRRVKFISVPLSILQGDARLLPWSESTHSRGITHSIWPLIMCYFIAESYPVFGLPLFVGMASHLLADGLTYCGIRLLWPLPIRFRSPLPFATGSIYEYLVVGLMIIATLQFYFGIIIVPEHYLAFLNS